jgi:hypothetical protein
MDSKYGVSANGLPDERAARSGKRTRCLLCHPDHHWETMILAWRAYGPVNVLQYCVIGSSTATGHSKESLASPDDPAKAGSHECHIPGQQSSVPAFSECTDAWAERIFRGVGTELLPFPVAQSTRLNVAASKEDSINGELGNLALAKIARRAHTTPTQCR